MLKRQNQWPAVRRLHRGNSNRLKEYLVIPQPEDAMKVHGFGNSAHYRSPFESFPGSSENSSGRHMDLNRSKNDGHVLVVVQCE